MRETGDSDGLRRRDVLQYAGAGAAAAALAGCSQDEETTSPTQADDGGTGDDGADGGGTDAETTTSTANALAGETLKVGVLAPLPNANPLGKAMVNSARLAAKRLSKEGVLGADVEVVVGDTEANPSSAKQAYLKLVQRENVDVTTGIFLNTVLTALMPRIASSETLHLTTGAVGTRAARLIAKNYEKYKYHFRVGPVNVTDISAAQLELLDLYADQLGWESAALYVENLPAFDPYYKLVEQKIGDNLDLVSKGRTPTTLQHWTPVFDKVENAGADVMLVGLALSGISATKIWANQKRPFEFGGIHVPSMVHRFYRATNGDCEYIFSMNSVTPQSHNTPRTQEFMQAYHAAFDGYPSYAGPITYDAVRMYADAIRKTGSTAPTELIPYLERRTYTEGVVYPKHDFQGPKATFPHDPVWHCMSKQTCGEQASGLPLWQQWQSRDGEGVQAVFAPKQNRTADYQKPPWIE